MQMPNAGKFRGALLGLACGDALGAPVEFRKRGSFKSISDMQSGGVFNLRAGQWTDDTSMALCLATSLTECNGFDANDQMQRYCRWKDSGYLSSTGTCFDMGIATKQALNRFKKMGNPLSGDVNPDKAGNGCLMRLVPVSLFYYNDKAKAIEMSGVSARTTHGAPECVEASRLFGAMLYEAIHGTDKKAVLCQTIELESNKLNQLMQGAYFDKCEHEIKGSGYVVDSLEAALWCFYSTDSFEAAVLKAVNLGDDADTTAAICGQLAGVFYGEQAIPQRWLKVLHKRSFITDIADKLFASAQRNNI